MEKLQLMSEGRLSVPGALSSVSTSWMKVAKTVAVHVSPATKFVLGMMTQELPAPAATVASLWLPVVTQVMSYQFGSTVTGSEKVTMTLPSRGTMVELATGSVLVMEGPSSVIGVVRRGLGVPVMKSLALLSVSVVPLFLRKMAVLLLGAGASTFPSAELAGPYPRKAA